MREDERVHRGVLGFVFISGSASGVFSVPGSLRNYSVSFIGNLEKEVEFPASTLRRTVSHSCECMKGLRARVSNCSSL